MTLEESIVLDHWFTYHPPTPDKLPKYDAIRKAAKAFAIVVLENCPASADRAAAIRQIREAAMTANASIAYDAGEAPVG